MAGKEMMEISDLNLMSFLAARGVLFKVKKPSLLSGMDDRIEIRFEIEASDDVRRLIADYMSDQPIGVRTFLKFSKLVKDLTMAEVRSVRRHHFCDGVRA